ncbi:PQQ-binding-like beta-propeller repeat protein [Crateriforma conspicua]|uniref:PQQ-binding-like beta-propeller repeat protein n=1 Tax=Crateriforma conspicua TaxID=2527996 RepID=UPI001188714B|nr:PQQ-binding-like beta-propeller repeat protein [Crateriforma conspicua]QDV65230.1 outer membrane biogenesis protein BamB [Crateriforma conspicua]
MKASAVDRGTLGLVALIAVVVAVGWISVRPTQQVRMRLPGQDGAPATVSLKSDAVAVPIPGQPVAGAGVAGVTDGTWMGFRGPNGGNVVTETPTLRTDWTSDGPGKQWEITLCEGYAGAAVSNGRVYVLDYDETVQSDVLRCLSLADGQEIWRNSYPVPVTRNHGITRTVPTIAGGLVITLGPRCHLAVWDASTGKNLWLKSLVADYQAVEPRWYVGQCPLVDEGKLILGVGGTALLVALDIKTGDVIWESANPRQWEMTHSSVVPMNVGGTHMYVYCGSGGIAGVDADSGKILWDTTSWPVQFAHAPSPLVLPNGRFLVSSGYGSKVGAILFQVSDTVDGVDIVKEFTPKEFNSEQQTPIVYQQHIFGVRKRGGGVLVCMDLDGNEVWSSGRDRFGHGPYLIADNKIWLLDDHGTLTAVQANTKSYEPIAQAEIFPDGHDAWGPMAIVDGKLILREMTRMACLDLLPASEPQN